ncbi:MAG: hypothetical protein M1834_004324 [Cirrosporium novae-zelandiae]|nr:MAG: hypothetical protein M1834_004324 [Cirrosporium novae-zelandiae]
MNLQGPSFATALALCSPVPSPSLLNSSFPSPTPGLSRPENASEQAANNTHNEYFNTDIMQEDLIDLTSQDNEVSTIALDTEHVTYQSDLQTILDFVDTSALLDMPSLEAEQPTKTKNKSPGEPYFVLHPLDLGHAIQIQKYQEDRQIRAEARLQAWKISTALCSRLARCGKSAYKSLVENFRLDDKKNFVQTFTAFHDIQTTFQATWTNSLQETDVNAKSKNHRWIGSGDGLSFINQISSESRSSLITLLNRIRNEPDFLADRIASLSSLQLSSLAASYQSLDTVGSVLSQHPRLRIASPSPKRSANPGSAVERLFSLERSDPFSTLLFNIFGNSWDLHSPEYLRRSQAWSAVCARLIREGRTGSEHFITSVLNAWASATAWPLKTNLELYLSETLHNGAFLLDTQDDSSLFKAEPTSDPTEMQSRVNCFFENATSRIFNLLDDSVINFGLPKGVVAFAAAILDKLHDTKKQRTFRNFLLATWFGSKLLFNTILFPESQALMMEHHIGDQTRQKVLRELGSRVQQQILCIIYPMRQSTTTLPEASSYVDHVFRYLEQHGSSNPERPNQISTRQCEANSLINEYDYLLLSAPDLLGVVNTVYPENRPRSLFPDHFGRGSEFSSRTSSIVGLPLSPSPLTPRCSNDTISIKSGKSFSLNSDTSQSPVDSLISNVGNLQQSESGLRLSQLIADERLVKDEHLENRLKIARAELSNIFAFERPTGTQDPCAEDWVTLNICRDGSDLTCVPDKPHQLSRGEDSLAAEDTSQPDWPGNIDNMDIEEVKKVIVRLLENMEPSHLASLENISERPENMFKKEAAFIEGLLQEALNRSEIESDFVGAHFWWELIQTFELHSSKLLAVGEQPSILAEISKDAELATDRSLQAIKNCEDWFTALKPVQGQQNAGLVNTTKNVQKLRDKMWYISDVRNSSKFEEARNIAIALRAMAKPSKNSRNGFISAARPRNMSRALGGSFLLRTETQTVSIMTAPKEQGGSSKLADAQVEMTAKWLAQSGIENFCKGEERIHRFCLEIHKCVNKIVGDGILDGPVLWSSELYQQEKRMFASQRPKESTFSNLPRPSSGSSDEGSMWHSRSGLRNLGFVPKPTFTSRDSITEHTGLRQTADPDKRNTQRDSLYSNYSYSSDQYPSSLSTVSTNSMSTFWSPAVTPANAPTEVSSIRSRPSSFYETQAPQGNRIDGEIDKDAFLRRLKGTLTSLLLSDIGYTVWHQGSETDGWFSGGFGAECLRWNQEKRSRIPRILKKKRSSQSLRESTSTSELKPDGRAAIHRRSQSLAPPSRSARAEGNSDGGDKTGVINEESEQSPNLDPQSPAFPAEKAFKAIFKKISSHPNPLIKLQSIYDLKRLVVSLLKSNQIGSAYAPVTTTYRSKPSHSYAPHSRDSSDRSEYTMKPWGQDAQYKDRRSNTGDSASTVAPSRTFHLPYRGKSISRDPGRDQVVEVLKDLLRDNSTCPHTLFRDLQFIASFVPSDVLEKSERGKAFWDLGLAALALKQDICKTIMEVAAEAVTYEIEKRTHWPLTTSTESSNDQRFTMEDAGKMWTIAAKEGEPVAQRELAIFYLTHPDLLPRVTLPLSMPRDIFKTEMMYRQIEDKDPSRVDPQAMCLAYHWMQLSAKGGDALARNNLREREEFDSAI